MLTQKEINKNRKIFTESDKIMAGIFKALSDINRYRIFRLLAVYPDLSISDIARIINISLPLASQHIRVLTHANLIKKERNGKMILPKLEQNNNFVQAVVKII